MVILAGQEASAKSAGTQVARQSGRLKQRGLVVGGLSGPQEALNDMVEREEEFWVQLEEIGDWNYVREESVAPPALKSPENYEARNSETRQRKQNITP
jgi:hypothetical protein